MEISDAFKTLTRAFHQESVSYYGSREDLLETAVGFVPIEKRTELAGYIDRLIEVDPMVRQNVWLASSAGIYFPRDEDLLGVLEDIRLRL